eukprot:gb/GFBE01054754.1/.p1 GENE.gb/GFBE01054754.1/~~gb/GFBE01054754.1/.p1  ORF type:complete len:938 (+),score=166.65 gb/GFBE01054754.1/:1-2814(+)
MGEDDGGGEDSDDDGKPTPGLGDAPPDGLKKRIGFSEDDQTTQVANEETAITPGRQEVMQRRASAESWQSGQSSATLNSQGSFISFSEKKPHIDDELGEFAEQPSGIMGFFKSMFGFAPRHGPVGSAKGVKQSRGERRAERLERHRNFSKTRYNVDAATQEANGLDDLFDAAPQGKNTAKPGSRTTMVNPLAGIGRGADVPLGTAAYVRNLKMQSLLNQNRNSMNANKTKGFSPICRNAAKLTADWEATHANVEEDLGSKAPTIVHWFEGGLRPRVDGAKGMELKRALPDGYQVAPWSGKTVPLIRHLRTGVVIWPVRLDLMPFFDSVEGAGARKMVTVWHFVTAAGFKTMIAPFEPNELGNSPEPAEVAEEIWDRIEDDLQARLGEGEPISDAPEFSLEMIADPPEAFANSDALCRAVTRLPLHRPVPAGRVPYGVAFNVPEDRLLTPADRKWKHTVFLQAPGTSHEDGYSSAGSGSGSFSDRLKRQALTKLNVKRRLELMHQQRLERRKKLDEGVKVANEVKQLGLLDGIVDKMTGEVVLSESEDEAPLSRGRRRQNNPKNGLVARALAGNLDEEEEEHDRAKREARERLEKLEAERETTERKLQKAMKAVELASLGRMASFFDSDPQRVGKLQRHLVNLGRTIQVAREECHSLDDKVARDNRRVALLEALGEVKGGVQPDVAVKARRQKSNFTEFARETQDTVCDIADEYTELQGDPLRDFLGGSLPAAKNYLESRGDPNMYHRGTGWTPAMMAVSGGNIDVVQLLADHKADLKLHSKSSGETCIHLAVYKNSTVMVHKVLELNAHGAVESRHDRSTALILAVDKAPPKVRDEMVRALLDAQADPNVKRQDGWTALGLAIRYNLRYPTKIMVAGRGDIMTDVPGVKVPPLTLWELSAAHKGLQSAVRSKLTSKDLTAIEKRWPGSLVGRDEEED